MSYCKRCLEMEWSSRLPDDADRWFLLANPKTGMRHIEGDRDHARTLCGVDASTWTWTNFARGEQS